MNDECKCQVSVVSEGIEAAWPACVTGEPSVATAGPTSGQCKHEPECEGPAVSCSVRVETTIEHTCGNIIMGQDKRVIGATEWDDLGVDVLVPSGVWGFWVKPICGQERRARIEYAGQVIWQCVVRCGKCSAAG